MKAETKIEKRNENKKLSSRLARLARLLVRFPVNLLARAVAVLDAFANAALQMSRLSASPANASRFDDLRCPIELQLVNLCDDQERGAVLKHAICAILAVVLQFLDVSELVTFAPPFMVLAENFGLLDLLGKNLPEIRHHLVLFQSWTHSANQLDTLPPAFGVRHRGQTLLRRQFLWLRLEKSIKIGAARVHEIAWQMEPLRKRSVRKKFRLPRAIRVQERTHGHQLNARCFEIPQRRKQPDALRTLARIGRLVRPRRENHDFSRRLSRRAFFSIRNFRVGTGACARFSEQRWHQSRRTNECTPETFSRVGHRADG